MKILIAFAILFSVPAQATGVFSMTSQSGGPTRNYPRLPFYFDAGISQNQAKAKSASLNSEQTLMVLQMGATFAVGGTIFAGVTYDNRSLTQYSETNASDGNFSGKREFFAPVVGIRMYNFVLKFDYQTSGDYKLDRKNASGQDLSYAAPRGYRATFLVDLYRGVSVGAVYESVSYNLLYTSGVGAVKLSNNLDTTSMGLALAYVY